MDVRTTYFFFARKGRSLAVVDIIREVNDAFPVQSSGQRGEIAEFNALGVRLLRSRLHRPKTEGTVSKIWLVFIYSWTVRGLMARLKEGNVESFRIIAFTVI